MPDDGVIISWSESTKAGVLRNDMNTKQFSFGEEDVSSRLKAILTGDTNDQPCVFDPSSGGTAKHVDLPSSASFALSKDIAKTRNHNNSPGDTKSKKGAKRKKKPRDR